MPEVQHSPVVEQSGEYISIAEAAQAYGLPLNVTQNYLRRSNLEFLRFRNIRFYLRSDVDRLLRSREKARHPEITEWYTVEDIMANYAMDRKSVYNFVSTHEFPRRKDGLKAKYSKSHVDELLSRTSGILDDYYTADQIEEKYAFDKRRLYKLVNRIGIPKRNISGKLYIEKEAFDKFMSLNVN
jgi:predicted DNA-binding transcriptional regulator AlpA